MLEQMRDKVGEAGKRRVREDEGMGDGVSRSVMVGVYACRCRGQDEVMEVCEYECLSV